MMTKRFKKPVAFLLVVAMVMSILNIEWTRPAYAVENVTFTALKGSNGAAYDDSEDCDKLLDGDITTKWCVTQSTAYIIFEASFAIPVNGYSMVTGNDTKESPARNPKDWTLYGCNDYDKNSDTGTWVEIHKVVNDNVLEAENRKEYSYDFDITIGTYKYFKLDITRNSGSESCIQLSEFTLSYCNHEWGGGNIIPADCVNGEAKIYTCGVCGKEKKEIMGEALGHNFVDGVCQREGCSYAPDSDNDGYYEISTTEQMYWFAGLVNGTLEGVKQNKNAKAVLTADITLNTGVLKDDGSLSTENTGSFTSWTPIGNLQNPFEGSFDGQGHVIKGLYINDELNEYVGLFGYVGHGEICNVGVVDSYLQGPIHVGGICGYNYNGEIVNCYNISKVSGDGNVGGICGYNDGVIANCYNNTAVYDGNTVGVNDYRNTSINKTNEQFKSGEVAYLLSEGDKVYGIFSDGSVWGQTIGEDYYPVCSGKKVYATKGCITYNNTGDESEKAHDFGEDGICKVCHAYKISNETELFDFAQYVNNENTSANAVLLADITVSEDKIWTPVGNNNNPYIGRFDGNGHTISGLKFNDTDKDYVGLFGYVGYGGKIADVGVVNCDFKGYSYIGGICGYNYEGTITGCYNTGEVSGKDGEVGGVCGENEYGTITDCYNTGAVSGEGNDVGGVCGYNDEGEIVNSYNTGEVSGSYDVGGVCGDNYEGEIVNSYNTGSVSGEGGDVGGVCGDNDDGEIVNSYNTGKVSGRDDEVGGVCGYNDEGDIVNSYNTGEVSGEGGDVGGVCGENEYGTITGCYNTGLVSGEGDDVGGVCGYNDKGEIVNSYNTGSVSGEGNDVGGVCGDTYYGVIKNCYNNSDAFRGDPVGDDDDCGAINKTGQQFKSGEVAYLLSEGCVINGRLYNGSLWGQAIGEDEYPVLNGEKVYSTKGCVTYNNTGDESKKAHDFGEDGICKECHSYKISNEDELFAFAQYVNSGNTSANAVLLTDITVSEDKIWTPMGDHDNPYIGRFDGDGHTISGLKFNDTDKNYVGLFGDVGYGGKITGVGVVNSNFTGNGYVGAISGVNEGTIANCYNKSTVGGNYDVGGICGYNDGIVAGSYNAGSVSGNDAIGGICGYNESFGEIVNCYNNTDAFGGNAVENTYNSVYAINKTAEEFNSGEVAYLLSEGCYANGKFFEGLVWGQTIGVYDTPVFNGKKVYATKGCVTYNNTGDESEKSHDFGEDGICKVCHSYKISNEDELFAFAQYVNSGNTSADAVLMADITVTEHDSWTPIGNSNKPYSGKFDGNGHTISGLNINDFNKNYVGLFGYVGHDGKITSVGVIESSFIGEENVGGICGYNEGTITDSYNTGSVSGDYVIGGICGYNYKGTITDSYNIGSVSGDYGIGGICGYNKGRITDSYNTGSVSGEYEDVGGICGYNKGTITNCYYNEDICTAGGIDGRDAAGSAKGLTTLQMIAPDALIVMGFGSAWSKTPADTENKKAFYPDLAVFDDDTRSVTYEAELILINTDTELVYGDELHFTLDAKVKYGDMSDFISVMGDCETEDFEILLGDDSIGTVTVSNGAATAVISDSLNAGNHTLTLKYAGSDYDFNGVTGNCQVTIGKKDALEVTEPTAGSTISYGQSLSDVTLSDNSWSWADKKVIPTVKNNGYGAVTTVDDKNYDYEDIDGYDSATHTVTRNIGVTVNKAVPTIVVTTNPAYDTAGKTVNVTVTVKNPNNAELTDLPEATLTYRVGNGQEKTITGGSFVIPEDAAKDTVITITATTAATDNYAAGKVTVSAKASSLSGTQENEPFIEGDEGKAGWDVISDEIKSAEDGDKIIVDMNGGTELPKNIVSDIKGRDIDLVLDMGNGFTWTINGKTVTDPKDVDMGISKGSNIPVKVINNLTGECDYTTITLAHNGDFGFKAVLTVDMGRENHGAYANLYYYNEKSNVTEFISSGLIGKDGNAKLTFTHASEYVIVIDKYDHGVTKGVDTGDKFADSKVIMIFAFAALAAAGFTVAYKKRKNKLA